MQLVQLTNNSQDLEILIGKLIRESCIIWRAQRIGSMLSRKWFEIKMLHRWKWGEDLEKKKSISGYVCAINNVSISYYSKQQTCLALMTMEAELALKSMAVQGVWLRWFFRNTVIINKTKI